LNFQPSISSHARLLSCRRHSAREILALVLRRPGTGALSERLVYQPPPSSRCGARHFAVGTPKIAADLRRSVDHCIADS
jgi:hypothetical protein